MEYQFEFRLIKNLLLLFEEARNEITISFRKVSKFKTFRSDTHLLSISRNYTVRYKGT